VAPTPAGGQIIDLMEALRASLGGKKPARAGAAAAPVAPEAAARSSRKAAKRAAPAPAEEAAEEEIDATPAAEALAAEEGIDLADVEGSGEEGRILKSDVEAAAADAEEA